MGLIKTMAGTMYARESVYGMCVCVWMWVKRVSVRCLGESYSDRDREEWYHHAIYVSYLLKNIYVYTCVQWEGDDGYDLVVWC